MNLIDAWLDELILCGYPHPITRRQAVSEMVSNGLTPQQAIKAVCYYRRTHP